MVLEHSQSPTELSEVLALTRWPWRLPGVLVVNPYNTSTPNHHMTHFANLNATVIAHAEML
jgi:hypothetical protein